MTNKIITIVSAATLLMSSTAIAAEDKVANQEKPISKEKFEKDAKEAWGITKDATKQAAENVSEAAEKAVNGAKKTFSEMDNNSKADLENVESKDLNAEEASTAQNIIGQTVYNTSGERVAKVNDIIIDKEGDAIMAVLGDGDFTGLGKTVVFDYNMITKKSPDGDVVAALTEEMIDSVAEFSYDREDFSEDVRVMPGYGHSMNQLLEAEVIAPDGQEVATVEDVILTNGRVDKIIVEFGGVLGLGTNQASMPFTEAKFVQDGDNLDLQLSADEVEQFKKYEDAQ